MTSALRVGILLSIFLATLSACAAPTSLAFAPTSTPISGAREPLAEAGSSDRVELAAGHYQLIMFYSPI